MVLDKRDRKFRSGGKKYRRVSADVVRRNAQEEGGRASVFELPDGVSEYAPDAAGYVDLDVLPFPVGTSTHPDNIAKRLLWYKLPYRIHRGEGYFFVCPQSLDKDLKCPFCTKFFELYRAKKPEKVLKPYKGQFWVAMNVKDPRDPDKVAIYNSSGGKFWSAKAGLKAELTVTSNKNKMFFETNHKGRTIRARFAEEKFAGNKYYECNKVSFKPREPLGDEVIERAVVLDKAIKVPSLESVQKIYDALRSGKLKRPTDEDGEASHKGLRKGTKAKKARRDEPEAPRRKFKVPKKSKLGKKSKGKPKCPIKGGVFGKDVDKYKKCATCPLYSACEAAS